MCWNVCEIYISTKGSALRRCELPSQYKNSVPHHACIMLLALRMQSACIYSPALCCFENLRGMATQCVLVAADLTLVLDLACYPEPYGMLKYQKDCSATVMALTKSVKLAADWLEAQSPWLDRSLDKKLDMTQEGDCWPIHLLTLTYNLWLCNCQQHWICLCHDLSSELRKPHAWGSTAGCVYRRFYIIGPVTSLRLAHPIPLIYAAEYCRMFYQLCNRLEVLHACCRSAVLTVRCEPHSFIPYAESVEGTVK